MSATYAPTETDGFGGPLESFGLPMRESASVSAEFLGELSREAAATAQEFTFASILSVEPMGDEWTDLDEAQYDDHLQRLRIVAKKGKKSSGYVYVGGKFQCISD